MAVLLARLGRFSARHRRSVVVVWLLALTLAAGVGLTSMRFSTGGFDVPGTDSSKAMATMDEKFGSQEASPSLQLVVKSSSTIVKDRRVAAAMTALEKVPHVTSVSNPFDATNPRVSSDRTTAVVNVTFGPLTDEQSTAAADAVGNVADMLRRQGLTAEVGGSLTDGIPEILGPSEGLGALLAFGVLVLTFGSLVAAGANMLGALFGVGVGVLGILAFSALSPIGTVTPILAVMLGLAVGIDYSLFILWRFRSELQEGRDVLDAIGRSCGTAGSSVMFAGATVVVALAGLTMVGIPFIGQMGLAAAFAVIVAVLMSLTLLPAMMSWMGHRALPRKARNSVVMPAREQRWSSRWGDAVTRRPWVAAIATVLVLAAAAAPVLSMRTSLSVPGGEDPQSTQRAAYNLVAEKFGAGSQDPLVVLVQSHDGDVSSSMSSATKAIQSLHDVSLVIPSSVSRDRTTAMMTVFAASGPLDEATTALVKDIRALEVPGTSVSVTGATAMGLDSNQQLHKALIRYVALIVGVSLLLLVILFRSLLVPLVATFGFLMSLGAGLGATVAIFQWGWLDVLVQAPQGNPLLSLLPILVVGILFGLAMDYQVFLVSRIHEAHLQGRPPQSAIRLGLEKSAPVIVAAAMIMTAVFAGFALSKSSLVGAIALALAVGVATDAILVRMVFVPAMLAILGEWAWRLPGWFARILPIIDVEGAGLSQDGASPAIAPTHTGTGARVAGPQREG